MQRGYPHFALTLMVNHACNLRCTYCYTGVKFSSPMPLKIGAASIERAFRSLNPGGWLDVGFFGGEPLLESGRILEWMALARSMAVATEKQVSFHLTTNGTLSDDSAWRVMMTEDLDLTVSFDGAPHIHDRHRRDAHGNGSAGLVESTIRRLLAAGKSLTVNVVVRPDNLEDIPDGLAYLREMGMRQVNLSLDLWTKWSADDAARLERLVYDAARLWRRWLPDFSMNWFDTKFAALARLPVTREISRCGFGDGEIAVAPSGHLYPCERLIGEDRPDHPMRLPGHVLDGQESSGSQTAPFARCDACSKCALASTCDTFCRCSNYIRTGDVHRPDGLLCILNKACTKALSDVFSPDTNHSIERLHHVEQT